MVTAPITTLAVLEQPLASVILQKYVPAHKPLTVCDVELSCTQLYEIGATPPTAVTLAEPSQALASQATLVEITVSPVIPLELLITTFVVFTQPLPSVI